MKMSIIQKPIKIYWFDKARNKCVLNGKSVNCLKKNLSQKYGNNCYICNTEYSLSQLQLEHKIPVEAAGRIFCESNLGLACYRCHNDKTLIDKKVIGIIKKTGVIVEGLNNSFVPLEEIRQMYLKLFELFNTCKEKFKIWYYGKNGEDYIEENDLSNREVLNEVKSGRTIQ